MIVLKQAVVKKRKDSPKNQQLAASIAQPCVGIFSLDSVHCLYQKSAHVSSERKGYLQGWR
jgi:hypothetical protein